MNKSEIKIYTTDNWKDYELLDTGEGEKLERVGQYTFIRPYEDAVWKRTLPKNAWSKVDGKFWSSREGAKSGWKITSKILPKWEMAYQGMKFWSMPTPFRHYGFFPEQASHWDFIEAKIKASGRKIKFLNLFGYTGVASLSALLAGGEVTHLDASKASIAWAKENQELSGMNALPMRIITDDALKFLEREEKRGNKYDAVIMDPPKFGRGPKGETWKLEKDLPKLLERVRRVLSDRPLFVILNSYATDSSALALGYALEDSMQGMKGVVEKGELCLKEKSSGRTIPLSITAIWQAKE